MLAGTPGLDTALRNAKELMDAPQDGPFDSADIAAFTLAIIDAVRQRQGASLLELDNAIRERLSRLRRHAITTRQRG